MFYFAPGDPRLTEIRATYARAYTTRVILVPFPVGVGILKSSSCLTGEANPDSYREGTSGSFSASFPEETFREETKRRLIRDTWSSRFTIWEIFT